MSIMEIDVLFVYNIINGINVELKVEFNTLIGVSIILKCQNT